MRYDHVHFDIVVSLPPSADHRYILSCVDSFTGVPETTLIAVITTDAMAHAFIAIWVYRFGVPLSLISDRGGQFEANVWKKVMAIPCYTTSNYNQSKRYGQALPPSIEVSSHCLHTTTHTQLVPCPTLVPPRHQIFPKELHYSSSKLVYGTKLTHTRF